MFSMNRFVLPAMLVLGGMCLPCMSRAVAQSAPAQQQKPDLTKDADPVPSPDGAAPVVKPPVGEPTQDNQVTKEGGRYVLRADAYEVRLNASVIDGGGHSVDTLGQSSFRVYEDGVPQTIVGFKHEDVPVSLGILIDSSGSMYDKKAAVDAASLNLVKLSNPQDEAFLVDFSSEAYIDQDFTSNIAKLEQGLSYIRTSGGTALYDAVIASADYLSKNAHRPKQVLLIVTDGDDNASAASLESTIRRVQDLDGPAIYCIGLLFGDDTSRSEARHSKEVLSELAAQTSASSTRSSTGLQSLLRWVGIARSMSRPRRRGSGTCRCGRGAGTTRRCRVRMGRKGQGSEAECKG
jgi:hypothetical protein